MGHWLGTTSIIGRTSAQQACSQINTSPTALSITAKTWQLDNSRRKTSWTDDRQLHSDVLYSTEQNTDSMHWTQQWQCLMKKALTVCTEHSTGSVYWTKHWQCTILNRTLTVCTEHSTDSVHWTKHWQCTILNRALTVCTEQSTDSA